MLRAERDGAAEFNTSDSRIWPMRGLSELLCGRECQGAFHREPHTAGKFLVAPNRKSQNSKQESGEQSVAILSVTCRHIATDVANVSIVRTAWDDSSPMYV